jgi:hypothetical protein
MSFKGGGGGNRTLGLGKWIRGMLCQGQRFFFYIY